MKIPSVNLQDKQLKQMFNQAIADQTIDAKEAQALLKAAQTGGISSTERADLQEIWAKAREGFTPEAQKIFDRILGQGTLSSSEKTYAGYLSKEKTEQKLSKEVQGQLQSVKDALSRLETIPENTADSKQYDLRAKAKKEIQNKPRR